MQISSQEFYQWKEKWEHFLEFGKSIQYDLLFQIGWEQKSLARTKCLKIANLEWPVDSVKAIEK